MEVNGWASTLSADRMRPSRREIVPQCDAKHLASHWHWQVETHARAIIAGDERLVTGVGCALAVCFGTWQAREFASPVDFLAGAGTYLLLRIFLLGFPN